jgi:hypothetical protein
MVYRDREFVVCEPLSEFEDYWFTPPIGLLQMHLSLHSEIATLPITFRDRGLRECFFKIDYWGMAQEVVAKIHSGRARRTNGILYIRMPRFSPLPCWRPTKNPSLPSKGMSR